MFRDLRLVVVPAAMAAALLVSSAAQAQVSGHGTPGARFAPVDASALGVTRPTSLGFFLADSYTGGASLGWGGGAVRGFAAGRWREWSLGAGYVRTFVKRDLGGSLFGTIGGEIVGGYRHLDFRPRSAAAVDLTIPLGLALGDPDARSLAFYAAPYAEAGLAHPWVRPATCAPTFSTLSGPQLGHALGMRVGMRMSFGRLAAEVMTGDVVGPRHFHFIDELWSLGFTYRFGP